MTRRPKPTRASNLHPEDAAPGRLVSGIPRFDYILRGGFLPGRSYAVIGPPGSGKTIFANQTCFNHLATQDGRCVYMTLLVESHSKMIAHLSGLQFFDKRAIPDQLLYISGYRSLRERGLSGVLDDVRRTLNERRPTLFVVDGVESLAQYARDPRELRELINGLQSYTAMVGCTLFLLTATRDRAHDENTLVDGVIELSDQLVGPRAVRELVVHKFRGSDYLRGRHEVEITDEGMVVHPRTEIQFDKPPERATEERIRMRFGIERLDEMLNGGLLSGSATALLGAPGTGKTALGLSFLLEGARQGQKGVYFGFYEPPPRLIEKAEQIGLPLERFVEDGMIELLWQPPLEHLMDSLAEQLLEKMRRDRAPRRRLFIDGIEGFRAAAVYGDRMPRFLSAFANQLRTEDVTTVVSEELDLFGSGIRMPNPELANAVETVIAARYVELRSQLYRLISIMKMRESKYDTSIREFRITDEGIEVAESFDSAEAILSGQARTIALPPARRPTARKPARTPARKPRKRS